MLAMAVSSEASASAVKIAATAQRRSSGGKPSMPGVAGAAVKSQDIMIGFSTVGCGAPWGRALPTLAAPQARRCMMRMRIRCENDGITRLPAGIACICGISAADFRLPFRPPYDRLGSRRIAAARSETRSENGRSQG